jgi:NAD(P)-dependent dehydrogenase (short-subunit alcohol dehydrogenase family)
MMHSSSLTNKTFLVVGSSQNLGETLSRILFLRHGCNVILTSRNIKRNEEIAFELNNNNNNIHRKNKAIPIQMDATNEQEVIHCVHYIQKNCPGGLLDGLIFCCGINDSSSILEWTDTKSFIQVIQTNLIAAGMVTHYFLPLLPRNLNNRNQLSSNNNNTGGWIISITSLAGIMGVVPLGATYSASKAGMDAFFSSIKVELDGVGIRSLIVDPGSFVGDSPRQLTSSSNEAYSMARKNRRSESVQVVAERIITRIEQGKPGRMYSMSRFKILFGLTCKLFFPSTFEYYALKVRGKKSGHHHSNSIGGIIQDSNDNDIKMNDFNNENIDQGIEQRRLL